MSDIDTGKDADFSEDRLIERYNSDLANNLGNLLNRGLDMTHRFCSGKLSQKNTRIDKLLSSDPETARKIAFADLDNYSVPQELVVVRRAMDDVWLKQTTKDFEAHQIDGVLYVIRRCAEALNRMLQNTHPWILAKVKLPERDADVSATLYYLAESLRIIAILISPIVSKAAHGIFDQLNWKMELSGKEERFALADAEWGRLPDGHIVGKPMPLFPRIEISG
jgi:methionyl-tRNA synthetase